MQYDFEWDPAKAKENLRNHGVSFERTAEIFLDPYALSIFDEEHSTYEERWITIGQDRRGVLILAVHTFRGIGTQNCTVRLISARKATKRETEQYSSR
jgi:uncharacterized DUF497 family protein